MNTEPVVLINAFEVPPEEDDAFVSAWERAQRFLSAREGYLSTQLHRSIAPNADFRYVNIAHWQTPATFQAAISQPEFKAITVPFPFHASLYEVERTDKS